MTDILARLESPPEIPDVSAKSSRESPRIISPTGVNYLEIEARNHSLGEAGEKFVINFECARLIREGRGSLAERVEQVPRLRAALRPRVRPGAAPAARTPPGCRGRGCGAV